MNLMKEKLAETWDKHAQYSEILQSVPTKKEVLESDDFIFQWLNKIKDKKKMKLLDAGCGIGQYVTGARLIGFKPKGLDISPESVKIGKERGEDIICGDIRKMPFKDNEFDVVIAGGSMEHFPETLKGLKEANRVLKLNGPFLLNVPYKYTLYIIGKKIQQIMGIWESGYEKSFSEREFRKKLNEAGFRVLEVKKTRIGDGSKFPKLVRVLQMVDGVMLKLGFGGHHIWLRCIKERDL